MSKPATEKIFSLSGRRNRKSYFLNLLLVVGVSSVLFLMLAIAGGPYLLDASSNKLSLDIMIIVLGLVFVAFNISYILVGAQRCRDFGWPGWTILLCFIPYIGVVFWIIISCVPGEDADNQYGSNPLKDDKEFTIWRR